MIEVHNLFIIILQFVDNNLCREKKKELGTL